MYNVLIADDEQAVCKGLSVVIDWEKYGFNILNTAGDGEDALEKLRNGRYNLVITDIRMPVLDGLELIKAISAQNPTIKILIISGYSDFNYAKRAMEYGVKGYLLKPVDEEDLIEYITKIKTELDAELLDRKSIWENIRIAKEKLLLDFARGNLTLKAFAEKAADIGIDIKGERYCIALIEINNFNAMVEKNLEDANLIKFGIRNIVEEIVGEEHLGHVFEDTYGILGVLFCGDGFERECDSITAKLSNIRANILNFISTGITIGYGNIVKSPVQVKDSRKQAQFALQRAALSGDNRIIKYDSEKEFSGNLITEMKWDSQKLLAAMEAIDIKGVDEELKLFMEELADCRLTKDVMQAMLYNFVFAVCTLVRKYNGDAASIFSQQDISDLENNRIYNGRLRQWLEAKCKAACDYVAVLQKNNTSNIVNQIKTYIDSKYFEDLSLKSIAGVFYLSPAYLGRLFKNSIGEAFSDYLNKVRISKAKKMLVGGDGRVYEIYAKVGYNNHEHFYRQFKRYEGISFAEYKSKIRK